MFNLPLVRPAVEGEKGGWREGTIQLCTSATDRAGTQSLLPAHRTALCSAIPGWEFRSKHSDCELASLLPLAIPRASLVQLQSILCRVSLLSPCDGTSRLWLRILCRRRKVVGCRTDLDPLFASPLLRFGTTHSLDSGSPLTGQPAVRAWFADHP